MESGLKLVFLVGAIAVLIALLLISTIPELSTTSEENKPLEAIPVEG